MFQGLQKSSSLSIVLFFVKLFSSGSALRMTFAHLV